MKIVDPTAFPQAWNEEEEEEDTKSLSLVIDFPHLQHGGSNGAFAITRRREGTIYAEDLAKQIDLAPGRLEVLELCDVTVDRRTFSPPRTTFLSALIHQKSLKRMTIQGNSIYELWMAVPGFLKRSGCRLRELHLGGFFVPSRATDPEEVLSGLFTACGACPTLEKLALLQNFSLIPPKTIHWVAGVIAKTTSIKSFRLALRSNANLKPLVLALGKSKSIESITSVHDDPSTVKDLAQEDKEAIQAFRQVLKKQYQIQEFRIEFYFATDYCWHGTPIAMDPIVRFYLSLNRMGRASLLNELEQQAAIDWIAEFTRQDPSFIYYYFRRDPGFILKSLQLEASGGYRQAL